MVWPWEDTSFDRNTVAARYHLFLDRLIQTIRQAHADLDFGVEVEKALAEASEGLGPAEHRGLLAAILRPYRFDLQRSGEGLELENDSFHRQRIMQAWDGLVRLGTEEAFATLILCGDLSGEASGLPRLEQIVPGELLGRMNLVFTLVADFLLSEEIRPKRGPDVDYHVSEARTMARTLLMMAQQFRNAPPRAASDRE